MEIDVIVALYISRIRLK